MPEPLLVGRELTFRYGKQSAPIFSNLSLTVEEGETVLLMGPSGCGKSTLAYCLAGLYPEYAGELAGTVRLAGRPLESYGPAARARTVSILFQNPDNQFCMDRVDHEVLFALENINYPGDLQARMDELLELAGLRELAQAPIRTLSGGTKQKLALCTALATGARLLILDEPFANLDPASCAQLSAQLQALNRRGLTLLVVDHRPDWWRSFLTRVVLMEDKGNRSWRPAGRRSPAGACFWTTAGSTGGDRPRCPGRRRRRRKRRIWRCFTPGKRSPVWSTSPSGWRRGALPLLSAATGRVKPLCSPPWPGWAATEEGSGWLGGSGWSFRTPASNFSP